VHADEFFQHQEVMGAAALDLDVGELPWEWAPDTAARSVLTPSIISGALFWALRHVAHFTGTRRLLLHGHVLFFLPRLVMAALSLLMDGVVLAICDAPRYSKGSYSNGMKQIRADGAVGKGGGMLSAVSAALFMSTSWVMLVFSARPFSNTCEAIVLAAALGLLLLEDPGPTRALQLGLVLAIGTFTRFTFIAFFVPLGLALLAQEDFREHIRWAGRNRVTGERLVERGGGDSTTSSNEIAFLGGHGSTSMALRIQTGMRVLTYGALGGALGTTACVIADSLYYKRLTITPLNNALYNMKTKNLAEHGLHPRWLHTIVNLPLFFGPVALIAHVKAMLCLRRLCCSKNKIASKSNSVQHAQPFVEKRSLSGTIDVEELCLGCIISGVGMLSIAPHQEPRFLVPLVTPLALLCASVGARWRSTTRKHDIKKEEGAGSSARRGKRFSAVRRKGSCPIMLWILFNVALCAFYGVLHQGGLLRAVLLLGSRSNTLNAPPSQAFFFKTHMPPRFILTNRGAPGEPGYCQIADLKGAPVEELRAALRDRDKSSAALEWGGKVYVIAPASVQLDRDPVLGKCLQMDTTFWPHLSTEDWPKTVGEMTLNMFVYDKMCAL
jgi:phosphatidylinositol glycan class Z